MREALQHQEGGVDQARHVPLTCSHQGVAASDAAAGHPSQVQSRPMAGGDANPVCSLRLE